MTPTADATSRPARARRAAIRGPWSASSTTPTAARRARPGTITSRNRATRRGFTVAVATTAMASGMTTQSTMSRIGHDSVQPRATTARRRASSPSTPADAVGDQRQGRAAGQVGGHLEDLVAGPLLDPADGVVLGGQEEPPEWGEEDGPHGTGDDEGPSGHAVPRHQGRDGVGGEDEEGEEVGVGRQRGDDAVDHPATGGGRLQQAGEGEGGQRRDEGGHRVAAELLAPLEREAVEGVGHGGDRAHPLVDQAAPEDEEQGHGAHPEPEGQEAEERLAVAEPDPPRGQQVERGLVDLPVGDPPEGVTDGTVDGADRLALVVPEADPTEVAQAGEEGDDRGHGGGRGAGPTTRRDDQSPVGPPGWSRPRLLASPVGSEPSDRPS